MTPEGRTGRLAIGVALASGLAYLLLYVAQQEVHRGAHGLLPPAGITRNVLATTVLFALYVWLLRLVRRGVHRRVLLVVLALPVVYSLLWLPTAPVFSSDVFSYIAHGYVRTGLGGNPYEVPSTAVAASPIGDELGSYGWRPIFPPSPYGPLISHIEVGIVRVAGEDVRLAMLLFKLVALGCMVGAAAAVWWILGMSRPQDRELGVVTWLWNPAVLVEVAGEGHNDVVMALLVLLALGLTLRRRVALALVAMSAAALTKYLPALLIPLQLAWFRTSPRVDRLPLRLAVGALGGLVLAAALFAPFWFGPQTLQPVRTSAAAGHTGSTQTIAVEVLSRFVAEPAALRTVSVVAATALVLVALVLALRVPDADALLGRAALVMVLGLVVLGPAYWPWYVILPVALLALVPRGGLLVLLVAISLGSRLVAPLDSLYVDGLIGRAAFLGLTWVGAVVLPLLAVLLHRRSDFGEAVRGRWRRRYGAADRNSVAA